MSLIIPIGVRVRCGINGQPAYRQARRKRHATLFLTEAAVQLVNLLCYIIPNCSQLQHPCQWNFPLFKWCGWIRWTCWNTVSLVMSCPSPHFSSRIDLCVSVVPIFLPSCTVVVVTNHADRCGLSLGTSMFDCASLGKCYSYTAEGYVISCQFTLVSYMASRCKVKPSGNPFQCPAAHHLLF